MNYPYSHVLISLLKGVVYENNQNTWKALINFEHDIKKYFQPIGLSVFIDISEGYAFLRQEESDDPDHTHLRLIDKRQLSYPVTMLCILLRRILLESDASGGDTRVIVEKDKIRDMLKPFLPETSNEARSYDKMDEYINKVTDYGFLKKIKDSNQYEINRIIKAKISADLLQQVEQELREYAKSFN